CTTNDRPVPRGAALPLGSGVTEKARLRRYSRRLVALWPPAVSLAATGVGVRRTAGKALLSSQELQCRRFDADRDRPDGGPGQDLVVDVHLFPTQDLYAPCAPCGKREPAPCALDSMPQVEVEFVSMFLSGGHDGEPPVRRIRVGGQLEVRSQGTKVEYLEEEELVLHPCAVQAHRPAARRQAGERVTGGG